jgi:hypothetical protein
VNCQRTVLASRLRCLFHAVSSFSMETGIDVHGERSGGLGGNGAADASAFRHVFGYDPAAT